jgi:UDP-N-acetylmuramoyl-L-alanyl-D-glutamate--2,6-diaminopimelate ligase
MVQNTSADVYSYGLLHPCDYKGRILSNTIDGMLLDINGQKVDFSFSGKFNGYNILCAIAVADLLGMDRHSTLVVLSSISGVKGRFQKLKSLKGKTVIVDYAHTPDALKNVLETLKEIKSKKSKIYTVVGCGGNRDKEKRPEMARISVRYSDYSIFTSDNPRYEDPESILDDMEKGISVKDQLGFIRITDRKQAIKSAIKMANDNDIVLIAGKGHENYQEIRGQKQAFDDLVIAKEFLL